jgi:hypothetical protein
MVCQPRHRNNLFVKILQCPGLYKNKEKLAIVETYLKFQLLKDMVPISGISSWLDFVG